MDIYIGKSGLRVPQGPYNEKEVVSRMRSGLIDDSYLAWTEEMADWEPVRNVVNGAVNRTPTQKKGIYVPGSSTPYPFSRTKLDNFLKCQRCFYLRYRRGIKPPSSPPFTLNIAVDELLKREFDICRKDGEPHPLITENGVEAVPWPDLIEHPDWRNNFKGIRHLHSPTNLDTFGSVDDIWVNKQDELIVVDYKATSRAGEIESFEDIGGWRWGYKRQLEIYVWLLRQNGYQVSDDIYWVYANGDKKKLAFNGLLHFDMTVIAEKADDSWVDSAIQDAHTCLESEAIPPSYPKCECCNYASDASTAIGD